MTSKKTLKEQLEKYKHSFKSLKKHFIFSIGKDEYSFWIESPLIGNAKLLITKEEAELLEELMNDEEDKKII